MARPPGYATGAHVLAGCLPDRLSTVPELINTPTLPTVFSKHVPQYVYTVRCIYARYLYQVLCGDCINANIHSTVFIQKL